MNIKRATIEDVPRILECAREFTAKLPDMPLNEEHYAEVWRRFIKDDIGAIFLLENDNQVLGGIGGIIHADLLTGRLTACELFWYVKPEHRGGMWPIRLLKSYEQWAANRGCHDVFMIHMESSMAEELKSFYPRVGYQLFETMWRKQLTQGES